MRTWLLVEHYSAFLMKRFAIVMFVDHLSLPAGCHHVKTYQGLEVLLRAGGKGQQFGTQVRTEREETAAVECQVRAIEPGGLWRLEITQRKAPDLQTRCL